MAHAEFRDALESAAESSTVLPLALHVERDEAEEVLGLGEMEGAMGSGG